MSVKPKKKCCLSKPRCTRCPIRMLAEGTLPDGFTVHRLRLVKVDKAHPAVTTSAVAKGQKDKQQKDKQHKNKRQKKMKDEGPAKKKATRHRTK